MVTLNDRKMKFRSELIRMAVLLAAIMAIFACKPDGIDGEDGPVDDLESYGIISFSNPLEGRSVAYDGETVSLVLYTEAAYTAELINHAGEDGWAEMAKGETGIEGRNTIRIQFSENKSEQERKAELMVTVDGFKRVSLAVFVQNKAGMTDAVKKNLAINTYMHERLQEEYLWADDYNKLDIDLEMDYSQFLSHHLMQLGDVNIWDGGLTRANSADPGKRFIYSNIQEVAASTKAYSTAGLGFGPIFSSQISQDGVIGLSLSYVHIGSPAYEAGMKRGDTIYKVNGTVLTMSNYQSVMNELYYSPSGTYTFEFISNADMNNAYSATVTTASYIYNPVLFSGIMKDEAGQHVIGYLVLENFDLNCQEFVSDYVAQLAEEKITDLILDLRYNPGGSVAQSRYLASAIAGSSHLDDTFVKVTFRDGSTQNWTFRGGPEDQDGLGAAPDLGLERLYVIGSYSTASASELIINGLKGVDFPVYIYGGRTEGKNVGMTTTQTTYEGRTYMFSPITFYVENAKGFRDYPDGFAADVMVNNQNSSYDDDADNLFPYSFGDWGSMSFNVALRYAYEDIVGIDRASAPATRSAEFEPVPMGETPMKMTSGRWGNVIYR